MIRTRGRVGFCISGNPRCVSTKRMFSGQTLLTPKLSDKNAALQNLLRSGCSCREIRHCESGIMQTVRSTGYLTLKEWNDKMLEIPPRVFLRFSHVVVLTPFRKRKESSAPALFLLYRFPRHLMHLHQKVCIAAVLSLNLG